MFKDNRKIILTEAPYLYVNAELKPIINEIRKLIKEDFPIISERLKLPVSNFALGMTTFSVDDNIMHFFEVDAIKVKI